MKNIYHRLNAFSNNLFFYTSILMASVYFITNFSFPKDIIAQPQILKIIPRSEFSLMSLKPNVDLTRIFEFWNVKQVFLYCNLVTPERTEMIWYKIVTRDSLEYKFYSRVFNNLGIISDVSKADNLSFELRGNLIPYIGELSDLTFAVFKATSSAY